MPEGKPGNTWRKDELLQVFFGALDDRLEELLVAGSLAEPIQNKLGHRHGVQLLKALPQDPHFAQLILGKQEFFAPRSTHLDVDGWEGPAFLQLPVQV